MCWSASAANNKRYVNIVFIGNSITFGAGLPKPVHDAPPVKAALFLSKCPEVASVKYSNRGQSGCTTVDYLPDTNTLFPWAVRAADKFKDETWADLVFSIMLGTNDSAIEGTNGCPVAPERYYENMKTIINRLLALYHHIKQLFMSSSFNYPSMLKYNYPVGIFYCRQSVCYRYACFSFA